MNELESSGKSCMGCAGNCCTYEANSMMITPLEAVELMAYLKKNNALNATLKEKIQETVSKYRLDHFTGNGKRSFLRKSYTCPFFNHTELGCPLPRDVKPYGCLAFNSHHQELKASEHCFSETELLDNREKLNPEEAGQNEEIKKKLSLFWDKSPIPTALLDLWDKDLSDVGLG
ncbi:MAG TPA: hypothetical protein VNJ01_17375 [Bacteriovoracaceae bacterium]|nr:hypothetical protein [Bacteriovoracaceae bacterium]